MTAFLASVAFVTLAKRGEKTQLATVALAAEYETILSVWLGATTAMAIAAPEREMGPRELRE